MTARLSDEEREQVRGMAYAGSYSREKADRNVATIERILAARLAEAEQAAEQRLAEVEAERDYHRARADALRAKLSGGVALRGGRKPGDYWAEWHRTHCAAAEAAARAEARAERVLAAVEALADGIAAGTADFMTGFDRAGEGISTRMSGETAAMVVMVRSEMESHVRALVAQQREADTEARP